MPPPYQSPSVPASRLLAALPLREDAAKKTLPGAYDRLAIVIQSKPYTQSQMQPCLKYRRPPDWALNAIGTATTQDHGNFFPRTDGEQLLCNGGDRCCRPKFDAKPGIRPYFPWRDGDQRFRHQNNFIDILLD